MTPKNICERLQQLLVEMGVDQDPLGKGSNYTITFNDSYGHVGGLRIYHNGVQLVGWEKFSEDFAAGKTVFTPKQPATES